MYLPLEETKLSIADTQMELDQMMEKLKKVTEIAIDLEVCFFRFYLLTTSCFLSMYEIFLKFYFK